MITETKKRAIDTNTKGSNNFTIKNNSKMFKILIDGLYTNKIQSITREIWANALDSHIVANKAHIPFEITFPNAFEPMFRVRDYGIGLTHDDVVGLYTTLLESTKEDTNDLTGKFGLGSKAPFSYSDSFSVTSIKNGEKNYYSAIMNEDGIPEIHHLMSEVTDEANGLEVSFPVRKEDINSFQNAANRVAIGFDVKPIVTNNSDYEWENDYSEILNDGLYVRMGCVVYPVDYDIMEEYYSNNDAGMIEFFKMCNRTVTVIEVPMGRVNMVPSRENLSYGRNDPTLDTIVEYMKKYKTHIDEFMESYIDKMPSLHIANALINSQNKSNMDFISDKFGFDINDIEKFNNWKTAYRIIKYKNKELERKTNYYHSANRTFIKFPYQNNIRVGPLGSGKKYPTVSPSDTFSMDYFKENNIYIKDANIPTKKKPVTERRIALSKINELRSNSNEYTTNNIYVETHGSVSDNVSFLDTLTETYVLGVDFNIIFVDDVVVPEKPKSERTIIKRTLEDKISDIDLEIYGKDGLVNIDDEDTKFIHIIKKSGDSTNLISGKYSSSADKLMLRHMSKFFDMPVMITTYSDSKLIRSYYTNIVKFEEMDISKYLDHIVDIINDKKKSYFDKDNIETLYAYKVDYRKYDLRNMLTYKDGLYYSYISHIFDKDKSSALYTAYDYTAAEHFYSEIQSTNHNCESMINRIEENDEYTSKIREYETLILSQYPMLEIASMLYSNNRSIDHMRTIANYINMCDSILKNVPTINLA